MAATQNFSISQISQEAFIQYHRRSYDLMNRQWNMRENMRLIDLAYIREQDYTSEQWRARLANQAGDPNKFQNLTLPIIKPQIRAAVAYQSAIFASDYPIFGVVSDPTYADEAMQMQAVIEENSVRGGWARELLLFFYDGFKYNISALECVWDKTMVAALETDITYKGGTEAKPVELIWQGNCIKRWDPYNTYFDIRCTPYDVPTKGEFAGHTEIYSRVALKQLIASLQTRLEANIQAAFQSPSTINVSSVGNGDQGYYIPWINPNVLVDPQNIDIVDWDGWLGNQPTGQNRIGYKSIYEVSTEYIRIIPSEFSMNVPAKNTPQIWKLIIINHSVVIYAERQTNAHNKIPVFFGCPSEDGLGYQTKSLAEDSTPFQQVGTAIMNGIIAGRRRSVTDRVLYDPSRVSEAHINNPNPAAKIPVRPAAFGKPVSESVFKFPYQEDQAGAGFQEIQQIMNLANTLNGQNQARQGQFVKGNKTDGQWDAVMSNATSSDQLTALLYEAQVFTPLKEVLKINMLQYQGAATIYSPSQEKEVKVDPIALRRAVINFKVTDGLLPADKVLPTETLQVAMQVIGSSPQIGGAYNLAPMFSYLMKTKNVNLKPFEKSPQQIAYEQAMGQWQQLAMQNAQKGVPFNVAQPIPQQFGYDPATSNPAGQVTNPSNPTSEQSQGVA